MLVDDYQVSLEEVQRSDVWVALMELAVITKMSMDLPATPGSSCRLQNMHRAIFPLQEGTAETKHGVSHVLCVLAPPNTRTFPGLASVSVCLAGLGHMSYDNAYASAYATLTPLQFLLTRAYVDSPYAIGLRKLTRLRVLLTQTSYHTTPSTHIKGGCGMTYAETYRLHMK